MKQKLLLLAAGLISINSFAQISITSSDMPVLGDTLRYSNADIDAMQGMDYTATGANFTWDFSALISSSQGLEHYKSVTQASAAYMALGIPSGSYGYEVNELFGMPLTGGGMGVDVENIYSFFKLNTGPATFDITGFGATLNGALPVGGAYTKNDTWYFLPLAYEQKDTNDYRLNIDISMMGASIIQDGTRYSEVDGWGTIKTPFFPEGVQCLRVKSEIVENDTIDFGGNVTPMPRNTIEYKWLTNDSHFPALWVVYDVTTGSVLNARYKDNYIPTSIAGPSKSIQFLDAYPNPVTNNQITVTIPEEWQRNAYMLSVMDMTGKHVMSARNTKTLDIAHLNSGNYIIRVLSGESVGYVKFTK